MPHLSSDWKNLSTRLPGVDLIRFMSILLVMGHHYLLVKGGNFGFQPYSGWFLRFVFKNGPYGVTCFFVVSGFLITRILSGKAGERRENQVRNFYVMRFARIFPLLAVVVAVGWTLTCFSGWFSPKGIEVCLGNGQILRDGKFWISLGTFTTNWYQIFNPQNQIGLYWTIFWSLAIEEQFYLFYPLLWRGLGQRARVLVFLSGVVVLGILVRGWMFIQGPDHLGWSLLSSFAVFDQIAMGSLAFYLLEPLELQSCRFRLLPGFVLALGLAIFLISYENTNYFRMSDRILGPTLVALGTALMIQGGILQQGFQSRFWMILSFPGKLSYGCYLLHVAILLVLWNMSDHIGSGAGFLLFMTVVFILAYGSYRYYETVVNRSIRKLFGVSRSCSL